MTHSRIAAAARTAAATVILAASSSAAWPGTTDALLAGSVASSASNSSPIVVVAIDRNKGKVAHRVFLTSKHEFRIPIVPGHYKLYAFVDTNGDGIRNAGEPVSVAYRLSGVMRAGEEITLPAFEIKHSIEVKLIASTREPAIASSGATPPPEFRAATARFSR